MTAAQTAVALVAGLLAERQYDTLERMTGGKQCSAAELERAVEDYGRTIVPLPPEALEDLELTEVVGSDPKTYRLDVDLWTKEEGPSDLTASLEFVDRYSGAYDISILGLHTL